MCRTQQHINNSLLWNWEGDRIEPETLIKKCRTVTGTHIFYNVDIREFITTSDNRIIKKVLEGITEKLPNAHRVKFLSRKEHSFDFRVDVIKEYISKNIGYYCSLHDFDAWLFPQETVTLKKGDCEDRAFLMASLMIASGISKYVVRVAFGKIIDNSNGKQYDHVWVMYKNEMGIWQLIEPMAYIKTSEKNDLSYDGNNSDIKSYLYRPYFVMNSDHLWSINPSMDSVSFPQYIKARNFWKGYSPAFGYKTHKELVNSAINADDFKSFLKKMNLQDELFTLESFDSTTAKECLNQFANKVSNVDISLVYEPRLHFDNALINESFDLIKNNLKDKSLNGLAKAFHALGDFYAHSSFACFAKIDSLTGKMALFETRNPKDPKYKKQFKVLPDYSQGICDIRNFSTNDHLYKLNDSKTKAINFWKDRVVSGRFGQHHDSQAILEYTQFWPKGLKESPMHGALPHHNEIAVDGPTFDPEKHKLFKTQADYVNNYKLRKNAAIEHISKQFDEWKSIFKI